MPTVMIEDGDNLHTVAWNRTRDGDVVLTIVTKSWDKTQTASVRMDMGQAIQLGLIRDPENSD